MNKFAFYICVTILFTVKTVNAQDKQKNNFEDWTEKPVIVSPGLKLKAPSDAIVLFSKNSLDHWESIKGEDNPAPWEVSSGKFTVTPGAGDIITRRTFGDCQLH